MSPFPHGMFSICLWCTRILFPHDGFDEYIGYVFIWYICLASSCTNHITDIITLGLHGLIHMQHLSSYDFGFGRVKNTPKCWISFTGLARSNDSTFLHLDVKGFQVLLSPILSIKLQLAFTLLVSGGKVELREGSITVQNNNINWRVEPIGRLLFHHGV